MAIDQAISVEEFLRMPDLADGFQHELVRGKVIMSPPPGGLHGLACATVVWRLIAHVKERELGFVMGNDTAFVVGRDPDTVRGPDVAYWSKDRLPEVPVGAITVAPNLAVEVLSPSNTTKQIREKIEEYFACGVSMVWVVAPEDRTIAVYRSPERATLYHDQKGVTVSGEDVLPGFERRLADLLP